MRKRVGASMSAPRTALPNRRANVSFSFEHEGHRYRATAGRFANGDLAGTPLRANAETTAILVSLLLQHGVDPETIRHSVNGPIAVALDHFMKVQAL
jgi:ribonucleoside-diphosphate reductase alpha chain